MRDRKQYFKITFCGFVELCIMHREQTCIFNSVLFCLCVLNLNLLWRRLSLERPQVVLQDHFMWLHGAVTVSVYWYTY